MRTRNIPRAFWYLASPPDFSKTSSPRHHDRSDRQTWTVPAQFQRHCSHPFSSGQPRSAFCNHATDLVATLPTAAWAGSFRRLLQMHQVAQSIAHFGALVDIRSIQERLRRRACWVHLSGQPITWTRLSVVAVLAYRQTSGTTWA